MDEDNSIDFNSYESSVSGDNILLSTLNYNDDDSEPSALFEIEAQLETEYNFDWKT